MKRDRLLDAAAPVKRALGTVRGVQEAIGRAGGVEKLPLLDGPRLDSWTPRGLAKAIEQEVARAKMNGWTKISIHMDLRDALALANALKISR
jgi:hypothetical protein